MGWFLDLFRLLWSSGYWNTRKSVYLLSGRRGACPCQTPSDSGRAHETGCEAVHGFKHPARFQRVCPLLERSPKGGWVCSVDAADVRPFWGRALGLVARCGIAAALAACLLLFGGLRTLGYEISFRQVAWPPAWREFRSVQSDYHLKKARTARAEGRVSDALLSLNSAYELDPANYTAGVLLAQLWQTGQPLLSDRVYSRLLNDHPAQREATAQAWYRALLARGDWQTARHLSGERILHAENGSPSTAWVQAFLFAQLRLDDYAALSVMLETDNFPTALRPLFALELHAAQQPNPDRLVLLREAATAATDNFTAYYLARRLITLGDAGTALNLASKPTSPLADREKVRLRLDGLAGAGRNTERASLVVALLERPIHPALCELIGAHLVLFPQEELARRFLQKMRSDPLPAGDALYPQTLSLFLACAATGDPELLRAASAQVEAVLGREFKALDVVKTAFAENRGRLRPENILPFLQPLPLDVAYALYERYGRTPP